MQKISSLKINQSFVRRKARVEKETQGHQFKKGTMVIVERVFDCKYMACRAVDNTSCGIMGFKVQTQILHPDELLFLEEGD